MSLSFKKKPPPSNNTPIGGVDKPKSPIPLEMSAEAHPLSGEAFEMVGSPRSMTSQEYIPLVEHDPFDSFLPPEAEFVYVVSCLHYES